MTDPAPPRLSSALLERLRRLPDVEVVEDPAALEDYTTDALSLEPGTALAVLRPGSEEGLGAAVRALADAGVPYVPRGAGSGLAGGAVPREAVILSTERLTAVHALDPDEGTATVEAGVITARIGEAAAAHGLRYVPDPASESFCTVGGNVAANAGGAHCLKHGVTTDHVLGLRAVLPDGETVTLGRGEDGGLDLAGLFIGSEGTLGIAARVTVRLVPRPAGARTAFALFGGLAEAADAVSEVLAAGVVPVALELIDRATLQAVRARHPGALPTPSIDGVAAALVAECEGFPDEVEGEMEVVAAALRRAGARELHVATGDAERERLWKARSEAYQALQATAPDLLIQDVTVPRTALPEILPRIVEIGDRHDVRIANFFHAGDGNLHPNFLFDRSNPQDVRAVRAATREIARLCVEAGGTITGEHGVGRDKRHLMELVFGPAEMRTLRALKEAFDPRGLANADKIFPEAGSPGPAPATDGRPDGEPGPGPREDRIDLRPRDLTVGVEGDVPLDELRDALAAEGTWLPAAGGVPGRSEGGAAGIRPGAPTVEELVVRAPPGPFDLSFGPVRRHLLACRVTTPSGGEHRWGRAVMKNVAGYDLPRLICGSAGRPGRVTRATFRLWPAPAAWRTFELRPGAAGPDDDRLELARRAGALAAASAFRPDAVVWRDTGPEGPDAGATTGRVLLHLVGTRASVDARRDRLLDWARGEGLEAAPVDQADLDAGDAEPAGRPGSGAASAVLLAVARRDFPASVRSAREALGDALLAAEGHPATGTLRCVYRRAAEGDGGDPLGRLLASTGDAAVRMERGTAAEAERVRRRRPGRVRELEARVLGALGA